MALRILFILSVHPYHQYRIKTFHHMLRAFFYFLIFFLLLFEFLVIVDFEKVSSLQRMAWRAPMLSQTKEERKPSADGFTGLMNIAGHVAAGALRQSNKLNSVKAQPNVFAGPTRITWKRNHKLCSTMHSESFLVKFSYLPNRHPSHFRKENSFNFSGKVCSSSQLRNSLKSYFLNGVLSRPFFMSDSVSGFGDPLEAIHLALKQIHLIVWLV